MKTEVIRHIFDGGKLNMDGSEAANANVVHEGSSCQAFRQLLGKDESAVAVGKKDCAILFFLQKNY